MMKVIAALSTLLLPPVVLAVVGGRCSGSWDTKWCICLDHNVCRDQFGGDALQGSPGNWPCPNDPDNVMGCRITRNCPTKDFHTACLWRNMVSALVETISFAVISVRAVCALQLDHCVIPGATRSGPWFEVTVDVRVTGFTYRGES
ncbi:hypothetical protein N657DRAFT_630719 [Parathielavia appendiculata]|uniref:Secreted protein n=1 Tax=Parathielavia appendiculata TaxID=2587402 RepID=A0AAN6U5E5_9PEZI|nr:hypothetical protein N657DRAFT_630719 [Parathielavia appendiculata]